MSQSDFVTRGQSLVSAGQYQEAVKVCRLGLLGRPTTVEGRVVLGQALLALKRYDEVLAEMRVALELDHASTAAQLLKGEAQLRKGDGHGAVETLVKLRAQTGTNAQVAALLEDAERLVGRAPPGTPGHAAAFPPPNDEAFASDPGTKNYPAHQAAALAAAQPGLGRAAPAEPRPAGDAAIGEYTSPTAVAPSSRRRSSAGPAAQASEPPPGEPAALRDGSGTVEVEPGLEVVEPGGDDDFGDIVEPPTGSGAPAPARGDAKREPVKSANRSLAASAVAAALARKSGRGDVFKNVSTVELGEDELVEVEDVAAPANASHDLVKLPPELSDRPPVAPVPRTLPGTHPAQLMTSPASAAAPQHISLRSAIAAGQPTELAMQVPQLPLMAPPQHAPLPVPQVARMPPGPSQAPQLPAMQMPAQYMMAPLPGDAEPIAPAMAVPGFPAAPLHPLPQPAQLQSSLAAARPTLTMNAAGDAIAHGQDAGDGPRPVWARPTMLADAAAPHGYAAPAQRPMAVPGRAPQLDAGAGPRSGPRFGSQLGAMVRGSGGTPAALPGDSGASRAGRSAIRKARSRLQVAVWVMIGAAVIGGGVVAGFQIRAMRLRGQIVAARERSVDLAKTDTWQGWLGARDSLHSIAQASPTVDNRAALARAYAVLAYEFGDSTGDARAALDGIAGAPGLDGELAAAYLALAQNDARAAGEAAERAKKAAPGDPAAFYVAGRAALLAGDAVTATTDLRRAVELEARPLYAVGLAQALSASSAWAGAATALGRSENPAAVITKGFLFARRAAGGPNTEIRAQLAKLVTDGAKPAPDQPRAISPSQVAFAYLALARIDFAHNELEVARTDYRASLELGLNDQRFAEELADTLYTIGELEVARKAVTLALEKWPTSRAARTTLAQIWFGLGRPIEVLDLFEKTPDAASWPKGQVVRGQSRVATGDLEGARADFDAALKKLPGYEPALIAQAWLDLAGGKLDDAKQRIEPTFNPTTATAAMIAVYAAIQRATGDQAARDAAKALLEHVTGGPSPDTARVQLELARIDREIGDVRGAAVAYAEAVRGGNPEARFEGALLQIEAGHPREGRDELEQLLKDAGDHPSAPLVLETARARTLVGAHREAAELLATADRAPGLVRWQLDRERARLAVSRGDAAGAARALSRALDGCAGDLDTFILAADTVSADDKQSALAGKLKALMPRLRGRPESEIIAGKLDLAAGTRPRQEDAAQHYNAARDALIKENATPRRRAQADYGLAAVAYDRGDDPTAVNMLALVMIEDPSIYAAYLFAAEIAKPKNPRKALELAQQATAFNPDSIDAWKQVATLAAQLANRKVLNEAITRVGELAPASDTLRQLQKLR